MRPTIYLPANSPFLERPHAPETHSKAARTATSSLGRLAFVAVAATLLSACQDSTAPASQEAASLVTSQAPSLDLESSGRGGNPGCQPLCAAPRMLFQRFWNGGPHIFRMNGDGSNVTLITQGRQPAWAPNYKKFAYVTGGSKDIHSMNTDGSSFAQLTFTGEEESEPSFSPDGTKIAFVRKYGANSEIFVMDANGSFPMRLTYSYAQDYSPAWSPDGTKIAFTRFEGIDANIMVMNIDGSSQVALTGAGQSQSAPAWSPDGSKIAYFVSTSGCAVAIMNADGSNQTILYPNPGSDVCGAPTFNASGTHLAYNSISQTTWKGSLYKYNLATGVSTQLTNGRYSDSYPAWSRQ